MKKGCLLIDFKSYDFLKNPVNPTVTEFFWCQNVAAVKSLNVLCFGKTLDTNEF